MSLWGFFYNIVMGFCFFKKSWFYHRHCVDMAVGIMEITTDPQAILWDENRDFVGTALVNHEMIHC